MTIVTQQISGQLSPKRVAAYMKKRHKENPISVQQCKEDENAFYITGGFCSLKVPIHADLYPFTLGVIEAWERMHFPKGEDTPQEGGPDQPLAWNMWDEGEMKTLTLTNDLREIPGARNKPGTFYRKLFYVDKDFIPGDDRYIKTVYIDKRLLDIFSPDLDELNGFLFETSGQHKPVRVSAVNGIVGYVMPGYNIEREWNR